MKREKGCDQSFGLGGYSGGLYERARRTEGGKAVLKLSSGETLG